MVASEIRSLYRDEDDLFRTVIKRIYEERVGDKWVVQKVESIVEDGETALTRLNIGTVGSSRRNGNLYRRFGSTSGSRCELLGRKDSERRKLVNFRLSDTLL